MINYHAPQQCVGAMRVSGIKVLAELIESARNICLLQVDTKAPALRHFYPEGLIGLSLNENNLLKKQLAALLNFGADGRASVS